MLLKAIWAVLVVIAMALMTKGLWATVHIEPTGEAITAERRGNLLILVAVISLVAAYPLILGALTGGLFLSRGAHGPD